MNDCYGLRNCHCGYPPELHFRGINGKARWWFSCLRCGAGTKERTSTLPKLPADALKAIADCVAEWGIADIHVPILAQKKRTSRKGRTQ